MLLYVLFVPGNAETVIVLTWEWRLSKYVDGGVEEVTLLTGDLIIVSIMKQRQDHFGYGGVET